MVEYKAKWTESQSELQQQLKQAKKDARDAQLTKEQVEDELRELSDAVEIATLDKEMAEEKVRNTTVIPFSTSFSLSITCPFCKIVLHFSLFLSLSPSLS